MEQKIHGIRENPFVAHYFDDALFIQYIGWPQVSFNQINVCAITVMMTY